MYNIEKDKDKSTYSDTTMPVQVDHQSILQEIHSVLCVHCITQANYLVLVRPSLWFCPQRPACCRLQLCSAHSCAPRNSGPGFSHLDLLVPLRHLTWCFSQTIYQGKIVTFGGTDCDSVIVNCNPVLITDTHIQNRPRSIKRNHIFVYTQCRQYICRSKIFTFYQSGILIITR